MAEEEEETFGMEVEETVMGGALHHPDRAEDKHMLSAPYPFLKYVSLISFTYLYLAAAIFNCPLKLMVKFTRLHTGLSGMQTKAW